MKSLFGLVTWRNALRVAGIGMISLTANTAMAGSVVTIYVKNDTTSSVVFVTGGGFQGVPSPSFPTIAPGATAGPIRVESPYPTSNGGSFYYRRSDNLRRCFFVPSRIRSSLYGPWKYPTTNVTPDSGVSCSGNATVVNANGDWTANFRIY